MMGDVMWASKEQVLNKQVVNWADYNILFDSIHREIPITFIYVISQEQRGEGLGLRNSELQSSAVIIELYLS